MCAVWYIMQDIWTGIYYTADALKSLYRWQYRTRTLKKRYTEDKNIIIL
jgi:hypothetical protein